MYIVLKRCRVCGVEHFPGERIINTSEYDFEMQLLENKGFVIKENQANKLPNINIDSVNVEGDIIVNVGGTDISFSAEDIKSVFKVLQLKADEAKTAVEECTSVNVLKLFIAVDSRKTVKVTAISTFNKITNKDGE